MRVMVADDAGFIRQIIKDVYESAGCRVVAETATGPETIRRAIEINPDLLVLDIILPGANGFEVAREIRRINKKMVILFISSLSEEGVKKVISHIGNAFFLSKPFTHEQLLGFVTNPSKAGEERYKYG